MFRQENGKTIVDLTGLVRVVIEFENGDRLEAAPGQQLGEKREWHGTLTKANGEVRKLSGTV